MTVAIALACLIALLFVAIGTAKILALAPMRQAAAKHGFSTAAYRGLGVLEVAGAAGVALGPAVPLLGGLAGTGLLLLLAGALAMHARGREKTVAYVPAVVCAVLVAGYLAVLFGATP
jgi:DoxX-like family